MRSISGWSFDLSRIIVSFLIVTIAVVGFLTVQTVRSYAQPATCNVAVFKRATPSDGTLFTFDVTGATNTAGFDLVDGDDGGVVISAGSTAQVVEEVPVGWRLRDVECETNGVFVSDIENGIELFCSPNGGNAECFFFDINVDNVPTLSEWGMIAAAVGLGFVGVFFAVRRRKAFNS